MRTTRRTCRARKDDDDDPTKKDDNKGRKRTIPLVNLEEQSRGFDEMWKSFFHFLSRSIINKKCPGTVEIVWA